MGNFLRFSLRKRRKKKHHLKAPLLKRPRPYVLLQWSLKSRVNSLVYYFLKTLNNTHPRVYLWEFMGVVNHRATRKLQLLHSRYCLSPVRFGDSPIPPPFPHYFLDLREGWARSIKRGTRVTCLES